MQGIAELVERQRLHVELDVGALAARVGAGEDAELRRRHGQRPAAAEGIVEPHHAAPEQDCSRSRSACGRQKPCRSRAAADGPADCARRRACRARHRCRAATASRHGPMPDRCSTCVDPIDPAHRMTSPLVRASTTSPPCMKRTPTARPFSTISRSTSTFFSSRRLPRFSTGLRKPRAEDQRRPRFWLTWK